MKGSLFSLIQAEGWELIDGETGKEILAYGERWALNHPVNVHLKRYRDEKNPELKYFHLKKSRDYLWPDIIWHYWTEERFREHCAGWNYMGWAGGASTSKSFDAAQLLLLFWLANPKKRGVVVASTTLDSLTARVWGYTTKLLSSMQVKLPYQYLGGTNPKILYPVDRQSGEIRDTVHGIFAVAARAGSDEAAIANWIGRHPDDALMLVLDECTDLNMAIAKSFPNLDSSEKPFQCIGIGNSCSKYDLHGVICTPEDGWGSIDPKVHTKWKTTQKNGLCMFFSCYNSPAVHEMNEGRKKALSKFLITREQIDEKEKLLGKESESFYRFVLGFWKAETVEAVVLSLELMKQNGVFEKTEWSGQETLEFVGGLDPAFSTGGDSCVLRLARLGQDVSGQIVLDFKGEELLFRIPITANSSEPAEMQIAHRVISILREVGCPIGNLCIDANGQGRALGSVLQLVSKELKPPLKIYSTSVGSAKVRSFDVIVKTYHELWWCFRDYVTQRQIRNLDIATVEQLGSRLIIQKSPTAKPQLEAKSDFRRRMGAIRPSLAHSPDEADAASLALQSAILNFGFTPGQRREIRGIQQDFIHEKLSTYQQLQRMVQQEHTVKPLEATFSSDVFSVPERKGPWSQ